MRVLVLARVYPNVRQPTYGLFVRERARHVAAHCQLEVVAPLARFPFDGVAGRTARHLVPRLERDGAIVVHHPSVISIPAVGKSFDGLLYALTLFPFLRRLRQRFAFDLIDAHFGYPDGVAAVLLGRALGCPVTVTLRGAELDLPRSALRRAQLGAALRRAHVIAVCRSLATLASDLGVDPARVRVIPNGVDVRLFHPGDRRDARTRLGLPHDRPLLVSVGGFITRKGHERVLERLPALVSQCSGLLFAAIGNSGGVHSRLPAIERLIHRLHLGDHVRLAVERPHDEIASWLRAADLFCLATEREGWSNAICEALACGLPVVTTAIDGNREIVRDGRDGYLVPRADYDALIAAIVRALDTPWDRAAIARRAAQRTWEHVAHEVVAAFRAALEAPPRRELTPRRAPTP